MILRRSFPCPRPTIYASSYLILRQTLSEQKVSSYYYICVFILPYMCPHTSYKTNLLCDQKVIGYWMCLNGGAISWRRVLKMARGAELRHSADVANTPLIPWFCNWDAILDDRWFLVTFSVMWLPCPAWRALSVLQNSKIGIKLLTLGKVAKTSKIGDCAKRILFYVKKRLIAHCFCVKHCIWHTQLTTMCTGDSLTHSRLLYDGVCAGLLIECVSFVNTENVFGWVKNEMKWMHGILEISTIEDICRCVRDIWSHCWWPHITVRA